jgi:hypothetical protein
MMSLVLLAVLNAHASTFEVPNCASSLEWGPLATTPGTLAVSHPTVPVGTAFGLDGAARLQLELRLPEDATVMGRGLPPLLVQGDPLNVAGYAVDRGSV